MAINTDNLETVINFKITAATSATENKDLLILSKSIEALNTSPVNLSNLGDSDLTALLDGHVLRYVASTGKWTSGAPTGSPTETLTSLALNGSALTYTDEAGTLNSIDLTTTLNTDVITDIVVTSPVNGEVLTYNTGNSQWENTALTGAPTSETFTRTVAGGASTELVLVSNHNNSSTTTVKEIVTGGGGGGTNISTVWDFNLGEESEWTYDNTKSKIYGSRVSLLGTPYDIEYYAPLDQANIHVYVKSDKTIWGRGQNNIGYGNYGPWRGFSTGTTATYNAGKEYDEGLPAGYQIKQVALGYRCHHVLLEDGDVYSYGDTYYGVMGMDSTTNANAIYRYHSSKRVWNKNTIGNLVADNENQFVKVACLNANSQVSVAVLTDGSVYYTGQDTNMIPIYKASWEFAADWTAAVQARMTPGNNYEQPKVAENPGGTYRPPIGIHLYWQDGYQIILANTFNDGNMAGSSAWTKTSTGTQTVWSTQLTGFTGSIEQVTFGDTGYDGGYSFYVRTSTNELWAQGYGGTDVISTALAGGVNPVDYGVHNTDWYLNRNDVKHFGTHQYSSWAGIAVVLTNGELWMKDFYNAGHGVMGKFTTTGSKNTSYDELMYQSYKQITSTPWNNANRVWMSGNNSMQAIIEDSNKAIWIQGYEQPYYFAVDVDNSIDADALNNSTFSTVGTLITSNTAMSLTSFSSIIKMTATGSFPTGTTTLYAISLDDKVTWIIPNGSSSTTVADASAGCNLAALETFDFANNPSATLHVQIWLQTSDAAVSPQVDRISLWTTGGGRLLQSYTGFEVEETGSNVVKITNTGGSEKTYQLEVNHT
jgi:hypothetical protein